MYFNKLSIYSRLSNNDYDFKYIFLSLISDKIFKKNVLIFTDILTRTFPENHQERKEGEREKETKMKKRKINERISSCGTSRCGTGAPHRAAWSRLIKVPRDVLCAAKSLIKTDPLLVRQP